MKSRVTALAVAVVLAALVAVAQETTTPAPPTGPFANANEKASYAIGVDIATSFQRRGIDVNPQMLAKGIADAFAGDKVLLTEDEVKATLTAFQTELQAKMQEQAKAAGEKNKKDGDAFLASNKSQPGVQTTASGLQYKVIKEGTGAKPAADDTVSVHYKGTLIDGTEFDSSYTRNQPATFPVKGVIPGWTEALQLMTVGSKYQLVIPSELGYKERGAGQKIGPNSVLLFEVELLSIEKKQPPAAAHP